MIILGVAIAVIGYLLGIYALEAIGVVILVFGAILLVLGRTGRPVAGRRYWW